MNRKQLLVLFLVFLLSAVVAPAISVDCQKRYMAVWNHYWAPRLIKGGTTHTRKTLEAWKRWREAKLRAVLESCTCPDAHQSLVYEAEELSLLVLPDFLGNEDQEINDAGSYQEIPLVANMARPTGLPILSPNTSSVDTEDGNSSFGFTPIAGGYGGYPGSPGYPWYPGYPGNPDKPENPDGPGNPQPIPEPATLLLVGAGAMMLASFMRGKGKIND